MMMRHGSMFAILLNAAACLMVTPLDDVVPRLGTDAGPALVRREPGALGEEGVTPLASSTAGPTTSEEPPPSELASGSGGAGGTTGSYECDDPLQQWGAGPPYMATFQRQTGSCANLPAIPFVAASDDNSSCETTSVQALSGCGYAEEEICAEPGFTQRSTLTLRQLAPEGPIDGTLDLQIDADEGSCASQYGVVVTSRPVPYVCDPLVELNGTFRSTIDIHENSCGVSPGTGGLQSVNWGDSSTWLGPGCILLMESVEPLGCRYSATFSCADSEGEVIVSQELPGGVITAHWAIEKLDDGCGCYCILDYAAEYYPL